MTAARIDVIDAALPQTQCGKCGHDGCRPYAEAIVAGEAINKCPPGGERTLHQLAALTGQPALPLERPAESPQVAVIREDECIGCTKCIQACPVDAILGAAKRMHTVIEAECTGCELCVAPCPVDCIDILPHPDWEAADTPAAQDAFLARRAALGRQRHAAREARLAREAETRRARRRALQARSTPAEPATTTADDTRRLKTQRVTLNAALKRLERQRRELEADTPSARELETRIADHREQLAALDRRLAEQASAPQSADARPHRQRMAVRAAEQALRRARAQLAHAERQNDAEAIAGARAQCEQARAMLDTARNGTA